MFPQCSPISHMGNIVSSVSAFVFKMQIMLTLQQGILTKIRACEHLQKFCEHEQASTPVIFASNSSKGQILFSHHNADKYGY